MTIIHVLDLNNNVNPQFIDSNRFDEGDKIKDFVKNI